MRIALRLALLVLALSTGSALADYGRGLAQAGSPDVTPGLPTSEPTRIEREGRPVSPATNVTVGDTQGRSQAPDPSLRGSNDAGAIGLAELAAAQDAGIDAMIGIDLALPTADN